MTLFLKFILKMLFGEQCFARRIWLCELHARTLEPFQFYATVYANDGRRSFHLI